jgi:hypothetical protein
MHWKFVLDDLSPGLPGDCTDSGDNRLLSLSFPHGHQTTLPQGASLPAHRLDILIVIGIDLVLQVVTEPSKPVKAANEGMN